MGLLSNNCFNLRQQTITCHSFIPGLWFCVYNRMETTVNTEIHILHFTKVKWIVYFSLFPWPGNPDSTWGQPASRRPVVWFPALSLHSFFGQIQDHKPCTQWSTRLESLYKYRPLVLLHTHTRTYLYHVLHLVPDSDLPTKNRKTTDYWGFNFSKSALVIKGMNERVQFKFVSNLVVVVVVVVVVVHRESSHEKAPEIHVVPSVLNLWINVMIHHIVMLFFFFPQNKSQTSSCSLVSGHRWVHPHREEREDEAERKGLQPERGLRQVLPPVHQRVPEAQEVSRGERASLSRAAPSNKQTVPRPNCPLKFKLQQVTHTDKRVSSKRASLIRIHELVSGESKENVLSHNVKLKILGQPQRI